MQTYGLNPSLLSDKQRTTKTSFLRFGDFGRKITSLTVKLSLAILILLMLGVFVATAQPMINSIYPPVLTERAGDHVAFTVSATGNGELAYQWYQNGVLIAGQTNASIVLTNIGINTGGEYGVAVVDASTAYVSNFATLNVSTNYLPLSPTNLEVLRLGDGAQTLSGATGNTIYLDQYTTNGTYVSTIQVPDQLPGQPYGVGTNKTIYGSTSLILPGAGGDSINQGAVTLSGNQQFITFGGYQLAYPYTGADVTLGGSTLVRGIYTVNAYGFESLAYTNFGFYSGGPHTFRSALTLDGTNFWTTGEAGSVGGLKYANKTVASYANGSGIPTISSSTTGTRVVQIANGNLVFSDAAATAGHGIWATSGLSEPAANGNPSSQLVLNEGGQPNDFAISPDGNTVYIADSQPFGGSSVQAGGIERWDYGTTGYVYSYTLAPTAGTNGAQNLSVYFPSNTTVWGLGVTGAVIYATTESATTNSIVSIVDNGSGSVATPLVTAGSNQIFRGLRFGPTAVAGIYFTSQPQSQIAPVGNNVTFSAALQGAAPFYYQWQFDSTNIPGATLPTLTVTNVQFANSGNYSVIVSNPATFITSSNAVLTVTLGAPVITTDVQSRVETAGDHTAFALQVSGTLPISYQWYHNSTAVSGATNAALILTNIQPSDSGNYKVTATNTYGSTNSLTATLAVTTNLQALALNNLVVARIGEGSQILSAGTGNTVYLDQYTTNGAYVSSIQVPDQGAGLPYGYGPGSNSSASVNLPPGSQPLIVAGAGPDAPYEALLTESADTASLNFAGYLQAYPANVGDVTVSGQTSAGNSTNNWRAVGGVSAYGYYSLDYTNSGLYSGGAHTIRSVTTLEGVNFWSAGSAQNGGIKYFNTTVPNYANGVGVPQLSSSGPGPRVVQIINGNLVFSDALASPPGIYVGTGGTPEPGPGATAATSLLINEGGSPVDFVASPDGRTVYISDNQAFGGSLVQAGGIERWDTNDAGGFNYNYTLATGTNTVGAIGLTAFFPSNITAWGAGVTGAVLFATTAESPNNRLVKVVDNGPDSIAATLSTSGVNQTFAGIRFAPAIVPVGFYSGPQPTNVFAGQATKLSVIPTGSRPYTYQWQLNNTNIPGATNNLLTLGNLQSANAGLYSVIVGNGSGFTTSSAAQLAVIPLPQFLISTNLGANTGFQLNFTGPAGYGYSIWTSPDATLTPVETTWTQVESGATFSGATDTFTDPNGGNSTNQFYIITVP